MNTAYKALSSWELPDYQGMGRLFLHKKSGAHIFHLANDDIDNMFVFAFFTIPKDSTGVAHILEHTVLSGSKQFPVKDPFLQLMKGSVNTFLNAMTYPDMTVYAAASPVVQDVFNMMRVYGDAVFHPLLKKEIFWQEGHRLQMDSNGKAVITGIVYNEMKGVYASHDSAALRACIQSLFPDTTYAFDYGGDPLCIPHLSYPQFLDFYQRCYHPSNARIMLYGNIETSTYLDFLDKEFLSDFRKTAPVRSPEKQTRWTTHRRVEKTFVSVEGDSDTSVTVNWLLFSVTETAKLLEFSVLETALLGHSGAPLAKALIDSKLGKDLSPVTGIIKELSEVTFSAGLRGARYEDSDAVEKTVLNTLRHIAENGIDATIVEGAVRQIEFYHREIKSGSNGLRAMNKVMQTWMHGGSPAAALSFSKDIAALRKRIREVPRFLENLITELLLNNAHRTTVVVRPQMPPMGKEMITPNAAQMKKILEENRILQRMQETPDTTQDIAKIPVLTLEDIPREVRQIPYVQKQLQTGQTVYEHVQHTNGIVYVDFSFDFGVLSDKEEALLSLFSIAMTEAGLPDMPFDVLQSELQMKTGSVSCSVNNQIRYDDTRCIRRLFCIRFRALEHLWHEGAALLQRIICTIDFSDLSRLKQIVDEYIERMKASLISDGLHYAGLRASRGLSVVSDREEVLGGISQMQILQSLADEDLQEAANMMKLLCKKLFNARHMSVNITAAAGVLPALRQWTEEFVHSLIQAYGTDDTSVVCTSLCPCITQPKAEFLLSSAEVCFVAFVIQGVDITHKDAAAQALLAHVLRTGRLWETIRMQGGAYGVSAYSDTEGMFSFGSYRDPHSLQTLTEYRNALSASINSWNEHDIIRSKVSMLGKELRPIAPKDQGFISFKRQLHGINDTFRQRFRDALYAVQKKDMQRAASRLIEQADAGKICVLGGQKGLGELRKHYSDISVYELGI